METLEEVKNKVVEKTGMDEKEVQELIDTVEKDTKQTFPDLKGNELTSRCVKASVAFFRKFLSTPADLVEAVVILDGGVLVRNRSRIQQVLQKAEEDPIAKEEMLRTGELMEVGEEKKLYACDMKAKYPSGDDNPNFKKPLTESRFRILTGRFIDKDSKKKNFQLSLNSNAVTLNIPSRTSIKFYATRAPTPMEDGTERLGLKGGTKIMEGKAEWNVDKEINEMFADRELPLTKFDEAIEAIQDTSTAEPNLFLVKGEVTELNLERSKPNIRLQDEGGLDDTPVNLFVKIPNNLITDANTIAPFSTCTVIGQIWKMPGREGRDPLRGLTAQALWSDEKAVIAKPVNEKNMTPQPEEVDEEEFS